MEIVFEQDYLKELYYEGKARDKKRRFQPQVVRKYIRVIDLLESLAKKEDMYRYKSLHYEALVGDKSGIESVRIDGKYRVEFRSEWRDEKRLVTVLNIMELSNHYKQ